MNNKNVRAVLRTDQLESLLGGRVAPPTYASSGNDAVVPPHRFAATADMSVVDIDTPASQMNRLEQWALDNVDVIPDISVTIAIGGETVVKHVSQLPHNVTDAILATIVAGDACTLSQAALDAWRRHDAGPMITMFPLSVLSGFAHFHSSLAHGRVITARVTARDATPVMERGQLHVVMSKEQRTVLKEAIAGTGVTAANLNLDSVPHTYEEVGAVYSDDIRSVRLVDVGALHDLRRWGATPEQIDFMVQLALILLTSPIPLRFRTGCMLRVIPERTQYTEISDDGSSTVVSLDHAELLSLLPEMAQRAGIMTGTVTAETGSIDDVRARIEGAVAVHKDASEKKEAKKKKSTKKSRA